MEKENNNTNSREKKTKELKETEEKARSLFDLLEIKHNYKIKIQYSYEINFLL